MAKSAHRTAAKKARKQPESLRLASAAPSYTVNDLAASIAWYRDVVGFHVAEEWKDGEKVTGARLRAGSVDLLFSQDDFTKGRDRKKGIGMRMYLATRQSLDALAGRIRENGGTVTGPVDQPWGSREIQLVDPDGFRLTISAE